MDAWRSTASLGFNQALRHAVPSGYYWPSDSSRNWKIDGGSVRCRYYPYVTQVTPRPYRTVIDDMWLTSLIKYLIQLLHEFAINEGSL